MTIRVYPSRLEGEPLETHHTQREMTLREWLRVNAPDMDLVQPQISVAVNGDVADIDARFGTSDDVQIWVEPRGAIIAAVIAAVVSIAISLLMRPKTPKQPEQGKALKSASLEANSARYGDPIPEVFGRPSRHYPDYLLPPRQYYTEPTVQWVEALLCIGRGEYEKSVADVYIGDTRAPSLGDDVEITFYEPGADLTGVSAADWWHSPSEVGFTSRGNSGMELGLLTGRTPTVSASAFMVAGDIISIVDGDDWPEDWEAGTALHIYVPYPVRVVEGLTHDVIESEHAFSYFTPTVGMLVQLGGAADGVYKVHSYTPPSGSTPAVPGTPSYYEASAIPARLDFGATPAALTIAAPAAVYTVALAADYASDAAMVAAINAQLNATSVVASLTGAGHLRISERSAPYSGQTVGVSGSAHADLFGAAPVAVIGTKTEPAKPAGVGRLTLNTVDDVPVKDLSKGDGLLSVTPDGLKYEVVDRVSDRALEVHPMGWGAWPGWAQVSSQDIDVLLSGESQEIGWTGPFTVTPPGEKCSAFEVDYTFPQGLIRYNDKGKTRDITCQVFVQWRLADGGGNWNEVLFTENAKTPNALGFTRRVDLPEPASIQVRLRRGPKDRRGGGTNNETVMWTGVRGKMLGAPSSYPGVTTMAIKLRTGDRISSRAESKVWLRVTRILEGLDGVLAPTRDLAPALLHIFEDCGYGRDFVDMEAVQELHDIWSARTDWFDMSVIQHTTVKRLANDILRAGFAELVIDRGLLTPIRDALRHTPNYIYSPQEFTDYPTVTTQLIEPDEIDGVDAEYVDAETGKTETVQYRLLGDEGIRAEKIQLPGVTDKIKAWRLAARHRRTLAYRRTTFKGTTELHALNSTYMSYDRIQDGVPEYGQSCFAVALNGLVLTVSEPLDWGSDTNRVIALRQLDGRLTTPVWVKRAGEYRLELLAPLPFAFDWSFGGVGNVDPTMIYFGNMRQWSHEVLITRINPRDSGLVDIEAVGYDSRVYADDDRDPQNEVYLTTEVYAPEQATSLVYAPDEVTSTLYPIEGDDELSKRGRLLGGILKEFIKEYAVDDDELGKSGVLLGGNLKELVHEYASDDELSKSGVLLGGELVDIVKTYNTDVDKLDKAGQLIGGELVRYVIVYEHRPEKLDKLGRLLGGELYDD